MMRKGAAKTTLVNKAATEKESSPSIEKGGFVETVKKVLAQAGEDHLEEASQDEVTATKAATKKPPTKGRKNMKGAAKTKENDEDDGATKNGDSVETHEVNSAGASEVLLENRNAFLQSDERELPQANGKKATETKSGKNVRRAKREEQEEDKAQTEELHASKPGARKEKKNGAKPEEGGPVEHNETSEPAKAMPRAVRGRKNAASKEGKTKLEASEGSEPAVSRPAEAKPKPVNTKEEELNPDEQHPAEKEPHTKGSGEQKSEEEQSCASEASAPSLKKEKKQPAVPKRPRKAPLKDVKSKSSDDQESGQEELDGHTSSVPEKKGARSRTAFSSSSAGRSPVHEAAHPRGNEDEPAHKEVVEAPQKKGKKQPTARKRKAPQKSSVDESSSEHNEGQAPDKVAVPSQKEDVARKMATKEIIEKSPEEEAQATSSEVDCKEESSEDLPTSSAPLKKGRKQATSKNKKQAAAKEADEIKESAPGRRAGKRVAVKASAVSEATANVVDVAGEDNEKDEPESKLPKRAAKGMAASIKKSPARPDKKTATTKHSSTSGPSSDKGDEKEHKEEPAQKKLKTHGAEDSNETETETASGKLGSSKPWNLKICSWNIGGIRAWVKKNGHAYIGREDPDILVIQETKCSESKLPKEMKELKAYHTYFLSGEQEGYSGMGLLSKEKPAEVKYGIGIEKHDKEGRVITAEYDKFFLVAAYVPNAGRKLIRLEYRMEWDKDFCSYLEELQKKKPVVLCGDMNVAHQPIDLENPRTNKRNAGFTDEEREGFSTLLSKGFLDCFRHLYPDAKKAYTFWTYMMNARAKDVGWRLDYFVLSKSLEANLSDSLIRKDVMGSDHCPIVLLLNM